MLSNIDPIQVINWVNGQKVHILMDFFHKKCASKLSMWVVTHLFDIYYAFY